MLWCLILLFLFLNFDFTILHFGALLSIVQIGKTVFTTEFLAASNNLLVLIFLLFIKLITWNVRRNTKNIWINSNLKTNSWLFPYVWDVFDFIPALGWVGNLWNGLPFMVAFTFFNWDLLHKKLKSHYKAWSGNYCLERTYS